jgi:NADPH2:quinone reductase
VRAIICDSFGQPADLRLSAHDAPHPGPGEVLIRVAAAGVNFADTLMIAGTYQDTPEPPFTPGMEVAGEVAAVADDIHAVAPGERVLAIVSHGGYADYALARVQDVFAMPAIMAATTAAGFPITYGTAHGALVWRAQLRPRETLLVHGAAGGSGLAAVEVGKALGARVIATASNDAKCETAAAHGADRTINLSRTDLRMRVKDLTDQRGADVIFDPVGGDVFDTSMRCIAWSGRIVVIGFASGTVPAPRANILMVKNIAVLGLHWQSYRAHAPDLVQRQFTELFRWYEAGLLHPHIGEQYDLADAPTALQRLIDRQSRGKIVLTTAVANP